MFHIYLVNPTLSLKNTAANMETNAGTVNVNVVAVAIGKLANAK